MQTKAQVLVVGAGPSGLAVSVCLEHLGIRVRLVDRWGLPGGAYVRMYPPLRLSSPSKYLHLPGLSLPGAHHVSAANYATYLCQYAKSHALVVEQDEVLTIHRTGAQLQARFASQKEPSSFGFIVVATGMYDCPSIPSVPGLKLTPHGSNSAPMTIHSNDWRGPAYHSNARVLIVGGGMRAVEIAEECVRKGLGVVVSTRCGRPKPLPRKILHIDWRLLAFPVLSRTPMSLVRRYCATQWRFRGIDDGFSRMVAEERILIRPELVRIAEQRATFSDQSHCDVDVVVLATGHRFALPDLQPAVPRGLAGQPLVVDGESSEVPNMFFLGVPCAFRADSHFIHGISRDAIVLARIVARRIGASHRVGL